MVKPPRGFNVSGLELFFTLTSLDEFTISDCKKLWLEKLDSIIHKGYCDNENNVNYFQDHNYETVYSCDFVINYFTGFVTRKVEEWTSCRPCIFTVFKEKSDFNREQMISLLDKGYLKYPTEKLFPVLEITESLNICNLKKIGCDEHQNFLTKRLINNFLLIRANILAKSYNKINNKKREETRANRKKAKLV